MSFGKLHGGVFLDKTRDIKGTIRGGVQHTLFRNDALDVSTGSGWSRGQSNLISNNKENHIETLILYF